MQNSSVKRAVDNVQNHNKANMLKFEEEFDDLFKQVVGSCQYSQCFENQRDSLNLILDKNFLKRFYNRRGFVDFQVLSYKRELLPDYSGYNVNIILNEGNLVY